MNTEKLLLLCEKLGVLKQLSSRGYIEKKEEEVIFTDKAFKLLDTIDKRDIKAVSKSVLDWIDEYRNIFPRGQTSGGYSVRGDKKSCIKKMTDFIKEYPEYTKEVILEATQNYVNRKEREGFKYMQLAHYFINKNGVSTLAGECEIVLEKDLNSELSDSTSFEEEM